MRASSSASSDIDAGREFFARLGQLLARGENLIVESTLSGRGISRHIDSARERGYDTSIAFIFLESADVCVARVAERARKGGHLVPEEDIRRRYPRSLKHFWDIHRHCVHRWHLFYNSGSQFAVVAAGVESDVLVVDDDVYDSFLREVEGAKA
jgi:predicted ABC-type ATPase